jgi:hypothetical protein
MVALQEYLDISVPHTVFGLEFFVGRCGSSKACIPVLVRATCRAIILNTIAHCGGVFYIKKPKKTPGAHPGAN